MILSKHNYPLTEEQKEWFGSRMDEGRSGRVLVPSYLYKKFKKIFDSEFLSNEAIKCYLIDECY